MAIQRKIFRIEQLNGDEPAQDVSADTAESALRHVEIMTALNELRAMFGSNVARSERTAEGFDPPTDDSATLKAELDIIDEAIKRTRQELVKLRDGAYEGPTVARAANELDAVVIGTESATGCILASAEEIEQIASTLSAGLKSDHERGLVQDIQERVTRVFEACSFHDLTGQRINKVVATLKFVETHIARMIQIWDGIERFKNHSPLPVTAPAKNKFLNGPMIKEDDGHSSQDDIDAMFHL